MEDFDLIAHLELHAFLFKLYTAMQEGDLHFYFSMLDLQFLNKDKEEVMTSLLQRLRQPASYKVANGSRLNKHGAIVQKFTNRKIDLSQEVVAEAIHLKGPEAEDTMPHIHFILKKNARLGRNYSLLKKHIIAITSEFGLSPHFDEMVEHDLGKVKNLANAVKSISWSWKKMDNVTLKKTIQSESYITNTLKLLRDYTLKTNNLTYYIKTLDGLKNRLNHLKLDLEHDGHNLRHTYPIPLTDKDLEVVQLLQERNFSLEEMRPYINTPLLRDFIRYSSGTTTSYLINALKKQTTLLDGIYKNQSAVKNYIILTQDHPTPKKSQQAPVSKINVEKKKDDRKNFLEVVASSFNEKSLREGMIHIGYEAFSFKKRSGKIIGFSYTDDAKVQIRKFTDLGINWSSIKHQLMENIKNPVKEKTPPTTKPIKNKQEPTLKPYDNLDIPTTISLAYKGETIKKKKEKENLRAKMKRIKDERTRQLKEALARATQYAEKEIQQFSREIQQLNQRISNTRERIQNLTTQADINRNKHTECENRRTITQRRRDVASESIRSVKNDIAAEENRHNTIRDRFRRRIEPIHQRIQELRSSIATVKRKINNRIDNSFRFKM